MKNYISADLYRVFRRIPRWIFIGIVLFAIGVIFAPSNNPDATIVELVDMVEQVLKYAPVYIGFIEIIFIYGDDFVGKTAQIAIGIGVKRNKVIMAKWLEIIIVTTVDVFAIVILALVLSVIKTHTLPVQLVGDVIAHAIVTVIATGAYTALIFPIMFAMQTITVAYLIYMLLAAGLINRLMALVFQLKWLKKLLLENYTLTNCLNVFRSRMILGSFQYESVVGIILYVVLALYFTSVIYKKRELDF